MTLVRLGRMARALVVSASCVLGVASCSDDDDASGQPPAGAAAYPRQVAIEYRITSTTGITEADITYKNETGGNSAEDKAALPFSKKFNRSVKQFDGLGVGVNASEGGSITAEILVDEKVVDSKTFTGTSAFGGSSSYLFQ